MSWKRHLSATVLSAILLAAGLVLALAPASDAAGTYYAQHQTTLAPGQSVTSADGGHVLVHQHDGNVVLYRTYGPAVWSTRTQGRDTDRLVFQGDGNLVLYGEGRALWHTGTGGKGQRLAVQNDANLVVYGATSPVWAIKGMTPPTSYLDTRQGTGDGCGGWLHTVRYYFGAETGTACRVMMCESGGNRYADNPGSTASGLWQFLNSTWYNTTGTYGPAAKYSPSVQTKAAKRLRDTGGWGHWECY